MGRLHQPETLILDRERRLAAWADLVHAVTLKDRAALVLVAVRAYEVKIISAIFPILERIHNGAAAQCQELIVLKLCLRSLRATDFILGQRHLRFQKIILELRILNCQRKLLDGAFNINLARALRRLHKVFKTASHPQDAIHRTTGLGGALGDLIERLEIEIHDYQASLKNLSAAFTSADPGATTATRPAQGGV